MVERRKQIEIEEQEIKRKEKELTATVKLPAEAEAFKVQTVAEGNRTRVVETAKAEGEKIKLIGGAEARAVEAVGKAEAESMRLKASAYKQYGDAAVMSLVLEALPAIAAEVAAPLAKTEEIVLIGGNNNTTNEINKLVGTLPPAIQVTISGASLQLTVLTLTISGPHGGGYHRSSGENSWGDHGEIIYALLFTMFKSGVIL